MDKEIRKEQYFAHELQKHRTLLFVNNGFRKLALLKE